MVRNQQRGGARQRRLHDRVQNVLQKGAYNRDDLLREIKRLVGEYVDSMLSSMGDSRISREP